MAKRKPRCGPGGSGKNSAKSAGKFIIPTLLKTEEIVVEDDIKQEISTPCTNSESLVTVGRPDNTIFYTCGGCGESGTHYLGLQWSSVIFQRDWMHRASVVFVLRQRWNKAQIVSCSVGAAQKQRFRDAFNHAGIWRRTTVSKTQDEKGPMKYFEYKKLFMTLKVSFPQMLTGITMYKGNKAEIVSSSTVHLSSHLWSVPEQILLALCSS